MNTIPKRWNYYKKQYEQPQLSTELNSYQQTHKHIKK